MQTIKLAILMVTITNNIMQQQKNFQIMNGINVSHRTRNQDELAYGILNNNFVYI